ncbi:MAG: HAD-IIIA family hydrolase [Elusimicrobiota bacterium]
MSAGARKVRLLLTDVDGVLTDGRLFHFVDTRGVLVEFKGVDTQDGIALAWMARAGLETGVISGRASRGFAARARMLRMKYVIQGASDKVPALEKILRRAKIPAEHVAFIGDDLPDIPVLRRVGWAVAPANARPEVKRCAHYVTRARGGEGAVRETVELILKSQGLWRDICQRYEA